jgi:hypothetical protein
MGTRTPRTDLTVPDVLRAIGRQLTAVRAQTAQAQVAADGDRADPDIRPPTPLPGYQFAEITITAGSPAAGRKLADVTWPPGSTPVTVLRGHQLRPPHPELTLAPGDRVSLLTAAPGSSGRHPGDEHHAQPAGLPANDEGLPIGVHFLSRFGDEASLIRLAARLEAARPWADRRPDVHAARPREP